MNKLQLAFSILIVAFIGLAGYTYYEVAIVAPRTAEQKCAAYIEATVLPQAKAECQTTMAQVTDGLTRCDALVSELSTIPACAAKIPEEPTEESGGGE